MFVAEIMICFEALRFKLTFVKVLSRFGEETPDTMHPLSPLSSNVHAFMGKEVDLVLKQTFREAGEMSLTVQTKALGEIVGCGDACWIAEVKICGELSLVEADFKILVIVMSRDPAGRA